MKGEELTFTDYYTILDVPRNADVQTIRRSYRKLVKDFHPDTNPNPEAPERFKVIAIAYEILSSPEKRRDYDSRLTPQDTLEFVTRNLILQDLFFGDATINPWRPLPTEGEDSLRGIDIETVVFVSPGEAKTGTTVVVRSGLSGTFGHVRVRVPGHVQEGQRIRLKRHGEPSEDGGVNGDLYIKICVTGRTSSR